MSQEFKPKHRIGSMVSGSDETLMILDFVPSNDDSYLYGTLSTYLVLAIGRWGGSFFELPMDMVDDCYAEVSSW